MAGKSEKTKKKPIVRIGGQALIEGIMMNGVHHYTMAVRKADESIDVRIFDRTSAGQAHKILNVPIIRGVVRFIESLVIGFKTLNLSADIAMEDIDEKAEAEKQPGQDTAQPPEQAEKKKRRQKALDQLLTILTYIVAIALAIGLFVMLPVWITNLLYRHVFHNHYLMGVGEGVLRLVFFLIYLFLISRMKDVARMFEYHGAEHKSINCFEKGLPLTVENVQKQSRYNRRCGTSFIFIILLVSILVFSFVQITAVGPRIAVHLLLVPVIAGISYEILRSSANSDNKVLSAFVQPGLWIQHITTNEPHPDEIEVAIAAVNRLLEEEPIQSPAEQMKEEEGSEEKRA